MFDLDEIVASIQDGDNHTSYFINTRTNEIIIRSDRFPLWEQREIDDMLDKDYDSIVKLPAQRDAKEFNMMRNFIYQLPGGPAKEALLTAIKGQGAFRRFREAARNFDLLDDWYDFRDGAYSDFARDWLLENEIEFVEIPKIYYRHAGRNDASLLVSLRKKALGIEEDDYVLDLELDRYYSHQLRVNGLYQVLAWCKREVVASGGIAFFFIPPTLENPKGRCSWIVDFWCKDEFKEMGCEQEILKRLVAESERRNIYWINAQNVPAELLADSGFNPVSDHYYQVVDHAPVMPASKELQQEAAAPVEEVVVVTEETAEEPAPAAEETAEEVVAEEQA